MDTYQFKRCLCKLRSTYRKNGKQSCFGLQRLRSLFLDVQVCKLIVYSKWRESHGCSQSERVKNRFWLKVFYEKMHYKRGPLEFINTTASMRRRSSICNWRIKVEPSRSESDDDISTLGRQMYCVLNCLFSPCCKIVASISSLLMFEKNRRRCLTYLLVCQTCDIVHLLKFMSLKHFPTNVGQMSSSLTQICNRNVELYLDIWSADYSDRFSWRKGVTVAPPWRNWSLYTW